jgi:anti-sigma B factor antagonist
MSVFLVGWIREAVMNSEQFSLRVTENGDGPLVLLAGELDVAVSGQFRECLMGLVGQHVTLDFTDVTFIDSTALGVLVAAQNRAETDGGEIVLHGVQRSQMKVFEITGLTESLNFDDDGAASAA